LQKSTIHSETKMTLGCRCLNVGFLTQSATQVAYYNSLNYRPLSYKRITVLGARRLWVTCSSTDAWHNLLL